MSWLAVLLLIEAPFVAAMLWGVVLIRRGGTDPWPVTTPPLSPLQPGTTSLRAAQAATTTTGSQRPQTVSGAAANDRGSADLTTYAKVSLSKATDRA